METLFLGSLEERGGGTLLVSLRSRVSVRTYISWSYGSVKTRISDWGDRGYGDV